MKWIYQLFMLFMFLSCTLHNCSAINLLKPFQDIKCMFYECCSPKYLKHNFTLLQEKLDKHVYGQPLVKKTLVNALKGHFNLDHPQKALVLSFHGSTGVGKNFVTQLIADSLFTRGVRSRFFKLFIATKDFPHNAKIGEYKEKIIATIEANVKQCHTSLFVFDEVDKIPNGLIDVIKAYVDYNQEVDGIDFRRSVFVFLSNSGAKEILDSTLDFSRENVHRDQFPLKIFHEQLQRAAYLSIDDNHKGLLRASLIESYLIDYYIPFLPLEREHVKHCIEAEMDKYSFANRVESLSRDVEHVADELIYEPPGYNKFSSSGCKRVPHLVRKLIVERGYKVKSEL